MALRPPLRVPKSALRRKSREAAYERQMLLQRFAAAGVVIMILPPYVMARVPMDRFDDLHLAGFMLRPAHNHDREC